MNPLVSGKTSTRLLTITSLLLLLVTVPALTARGQDDPYKKLFAEIDSLAGIGLPRSALQKIDQLDDLARESRDNGLQIKIVFYRMTFQSYIEEDALMAIITRLKEDINRAVYPVQPVLQSLLAEMYWKYYQQNTYRFAQRTPLTAPDPDISRWDLKTIINTTSELYQLSLKEDIKEQATPVDEIGTALLGDTATRKLRPSLYDFLAHRALDFWLNEIPSLIRPKELFSLNSPAFFDDARGFSQFRLPLTDTSSLFYKGVALIQRLTRFHLYKGHPAAIADLDMKRLELARRKSTFPSKDSLFLLAINTLAVKFASEPISADALFLLGTYYDQKADLRKAVEYFERAIALHPGSMGAKNSAVSLAEILSRDAMVEVESANIPGKDLLAVIRYKNISTATISLYKLSNVQLERYTRPELTTGVFSIMKQRLNIVSELPVFRSFNVTTPNSGDYRSHRIEFGIDPLLPGNYVLVANVPDAADSLLLSITDFKVSRLALVKRGNADGTKELRVVDRQTGEPLKGVAVKIVGRAWRSADLPVVTKGKTDADGKFIFTLPENINYMVTASRAGDTLQDNSGEFYGPEVRDDEHNEPRTILFSDRDIYRPGQTIYFKGLRLSFVKAKSRVVAGVEAAVRLMDANGKELSAMVLRTNDFGTFSGSFILPVSMLNGEVRLVTEYSSLLLKVEEYKRPTFSVEFLPVKEAYRFGDIIKVRGKIKAFAGYALTDMKVGLRINTSMNYNNVIELKHDTVRVNNDGEFETEFKAEAPGGITGNDKRLFNIAADATDGSGETRSARQNIWVADQPVSMNVNLSGRYFANDTHKIPAAVFNLNNQRQQGSISVSCSELVTPGHRYIERLWSIPDQPFADKETFLKKFPLYALKDEDQPQQWPVKSRLRDTVLQSDSTGLAYFTIDMFAIKRSGTYKFGFHGRNAKGDTISLLKYIPVIVDPRKPLGGESWMVSRMGKDGRYGDYFLGSGSDDHILMEVYDGPNIVSESWVTTGKKIVNKQVRVAQKSNGEFGAQFMMVANNRFYTARLDIPVPGKNPNLNVQLSSYRNILEPGQMEQWKVKIEGADAEKKMAEMVAGMYDASLDREGMRSSWFREKQNGFNNLRVSYNRWAGNQFSESSSTQKISYNNAYRRPVVRNYERLNMLGYQYYGGANYAYRNYLRTVVARKNKAANLEEGYQKSAAIITDGLAVRGIVVDQFGAIVPGASVTVKGTKAGMAADLDGEFKLKVPVNGVLAFNAIGFAHKEVVLTTKSRPADRPATGIKTGTIGMTGDEPDTLYYQPGVPRYTFEIQSRDYQLNEVVSAGMNIRIRGTSNILASSAVMATNLEELNAVNIDQALQGRLPGVNIDARDSSVPIFAAVGNAPAALQPPEPIVTRKNFNETAFFFPQLRTDEKGEISFEFTMPEALTTWKFRAFAHTKDLQTGYMETSVVTRKKVMISANMPRFFREGDTLVVAARLTNLTANAMTATVSLKLLDAMTMRPLVIFGLSGSTQEVSVAAGTNKAVFFSLVIPGGVDAITWQLTAHAGDFTDGEENTIPVLPNSMLVTEAMPMMVRPGQTKSFTFNRLINAASPTLQNKSLTLEFTQNPEWYAVQALPYLMEFPYECAEQTYSRYYANSMAAAIVEQQPVIKRVFDQWKSSSGTAMLSNLEKNWELKAILLEETPWLRDAATETEQRKRIALLFDMNKLSYELKTNLQKLADMQLADGSFPWFAGGRYADRFITQHILAGVGQLTRLRIANVKQGLLKSITDKGLTYLDRILLDDHNSLRYNRSLATGVFDPITIHAWYTRSYFDAPLSVPVDSLFKDYLKQATQLWMTRGVYEQAMIALTMIRSKNMPVAESILRSLRETAKRSGDLGMYWASNQPGYSWSQSPVETQSLLIEAFTEGGAPLADIEELKIWLLRNKQTNNWKTTKATAAACYALLMRNDKWPEKTAGSDISIGGENLGVLKPHLVAEAGTGYIKTDWTAAQVKRSLGNVIIKNTGSVMNWGAMYWQYTENLDKITSSAADIKLERRYFIVGLTPAGPVLKPVGPTNPPKTGDLLRVVIYLNAGREYEYIHLKDLRPAGTEPGNVLSGYRYQDALFYYRSMKDASMNFFINRLKKGAYVFEYDLRVAQGGSFSTGTCSVQCMYAPEFNAHTDGSRITFH